MTLDLWPAKANAGSSAMVPKQKPGATGWPKQGWRYTFRHQWPSASQWFIMLTLPSFIRLGRPAGLGEWPQVHFFIRFFIFLKKPEKNFAIAKCSK